MFVLMPSVSFAQVTPVQSNQMTMQQLTALVLQLQAQLNQLIAQQKETSSYVQDKKETEKRVADKAKAVKKEKDRITMQQAELVKQLQELDKQLKIGAGYENSTTPYNCKSGSTCDARMKKRQQLLKELGTLGGSYGGCFYEYLKKQDRWGASSCGG